MNTRGLAFIPQAFLPQSSLRFSAETAKAGVTLPKDLGLTKDLLYQFLYADASQKETLRKLISQNAEKIEFNAPVTDLGVPLVHMLARYGDLELFRLGVIRGADLSAKNSDGESVLHAAIISGNLDMVKCLLDLCLDVDQMGTPFPESPLMKAAEYGHANIVNLLLERGAKVNIKGWYGETALTKAAAAKGGAFNPEIILTLLARGADAKVKNESGVTPLMTLAQNKRPDAAVAMAALLDKGADVNAQDNNKNNVWRYAPFGSLEGIRCLASAKGMNVNLKLGNRYPIHQMACTGNLEGFKILEAAGADIDAKTDFGADVLAMAGGAMRRAAGYDPAPLVQYLLDKGFDVNTRNKEGKTPVIDLCSRGIHDGLDVLLANKADVNLSDGKARTALMVAAGRGDMAVVKKLIAHGAKLDSQDNAGMTAAMHAAHCGQPAIADALVTLGAKPELRDAAERDLAHHKANGNLVNVFTL